MPLTASLVTALRAIKHLKSPLVFCNPDGSPYTLWQLHERLEGACRRAAGPLRIEVVVHRAPRVGPCDRESVS